MYPAGQSKQYDEALAAVNLPTGQLLHQEKLSVDLNFPAGQGNCVFEVRSAR
jgi:hypothetical protein